MRTSEEMGAVAAALVLFQGQAKNPLKDKTVNTGSYGYTYAALPDIIEANRALLKTCGLAVVQSVGSEAGLVEVTTMIVHESGEWIESEPFRLPAGNTPQNAGGAVTYARRYSLTAILGLAADEDDDGARASAPSSQEAAGSSYGGVGTNEGVADPDGLATESQMRAIHKVGADLGYSHDDLREQVQLKSMTELTFAGASTLLSQLNQERKDARRAEKEAEADHAGEGYGG